MDSWICVRCKKLKHKTEFTREGYYKDGTLRYYGFCKTCKHKQHHNWYEHNSGKVKSKSMKQYDEVMAEKGDKYQRRLDRQKKSGEKFRKTDKYKEWYFENKLKKYGLTRKKYKEIFVKQNGQCAICFTELKSIPTKQRHIDHSNIVGVRGILCMKCNQGLGLFNHKSETLKRASEYIEIFGHD